METTNYFNEKTGVWEIVKVDDNGFPIVGERVEAAKEAQILYHTAGERQEAAIQKSLEEATIEAGEKPEGFVSGVDVINKKWQPLTLIPALSNRWPSWIEKEDGWYPPIDYPSDNPYEYMWDELDQSWIKYVSMEEEDGSSAS